MEWEWAKWLAAAIESDLGLVEGQHRIVARRREWNSRCNGPEEHRRVVLPGETVAQWATDAGPVEGAWARRGHLASARHCTQYVTVPVGTVVVAYHRSFRAGSPSGPATVTAGIVVRRPDGSGGIEWGLRFRRTPEGVRVTTPARTVTV